MKKLTELDLQTAMDECAEVKFPSHGAWLAGMVKRLNAILLNESVELTRPALKPMPYIKKKIIIATGNNIAPVVPCKT